MTDTIDVATFLNLHAGDTLKEISGRPLPEIGAEFMLLLRCWINGGSLPSDPERLRRLAGADKDEWPAIWAQLSPLWATSEDGLSVFHAGLAVQVGRARVARLKAIERGRAGGSAPHPSQRGTPIPSREQVENKSRQSRDGAEPEIEHRVEMEPSLRTPNSEPLGSSQEEDQLNNVDPLKDDHCPAGGPAGPGGAGGEVQLQLVPPEAGPGPGPEATKARKGDPDGFVKFWAAYPKRVKKQNAVAAWRRLGKTGVPLAAILTALGWQTQSAQWLENGGQYVPSPDSYLNGRRWEDEPSAYPKPGNGARPGRDIRVGGTHAEDYTHPAISGPIDMDKVLKGQQS